MTGAVPKDSIPKDSKDWTWVIDRPCPECGFDAHVVDRVGVTRRLRDATAPWAAILAQPGARTRRSRAVWSPLEYACHVRDVCRVYDGRLERMLTEENPLYPNWDQDDTAVEDRYSEQDPIAVGAEVDAAAHQLIDRFATVRVDQWERPGRRSDGASFTIDSFARYLLHDLVHHLWDVDGSHA
jgi:hypothetical protein